MDKSARFKTWVNQSTRFACCCEALAGQADFHAMPSHCSQSSSEEIPMNFYIRVYHGLKCQDFQVMYCPEKTENKLRNLNDRT